MRSVIVVVANLLIQEALEMTFIQDDHMVEQISTATPNPSFCNAILPGAPEAGSLRLNSEALHCVDRFLGEVGPTIKNHIAGCRIVGEMLRAIAELPSHWKADW